MSPSDQRQSTSLSLQFNLPPGVDPADLRFSIYDGWENLLPDWDRRVIDDPAAAVLSLPEGLYTVRWEYAGGLQERLVRLPQQGQLEVSLLRQTPAPVPGAADTHEYYAYMNGTVPRDESTGDPLGDSAQLNSRLHLLLRARNRDAYHNEDLAFGLRLLNEQLKPICELRERSRIDTSSGSLLCSLPATAGHYFLEYRGEPDEGRQPVKLPRLFPLHLFEYWQTRLFLFYENEQPDFASASLSLVRLNYDDSYQFERDERLRTHATVDMALSGLQNNRLELPKEIERSLLYGKFENPLLGLLGAHYLLQHPDASLNDPGQEMRWRNMAGMVLQNLDYLLPGSPDVLALRFKAALRFGAKDFPLPAQPVGKLPLLRPSLEALLEADSEAVIAIEEGSLLEGLAANLYFDSPWATFHPIGTREPGARLRWGRRKEHGGDPVPPLPIEQPVSPEDEAWLINSVQDVLRMTSQLKGQKVDWNRLASSLGVPYRKMLRVVQQVENQLIQSGGTGNVQTNTLEARDSQIGGAGNIHTGDLTNNTGVAIGRNIRQEVCVIQGTSPDEIAQAFSTLLQAVQAMPDGPTKTMAQTAVAGMKAEADKGQQADAGNIQQWFTFLAQMAPDIWEVAVETFANPIKGLSTVFRKAARQVQQEKKRGK